MRWASVGQPSEYRLELHDRADLQRVELERVNGVDRVTQQVLLDLLGASLQRFSHEILAEVQVAALDPAAREDALGELIPLQSQPLEHLLLRIGALGVGDGDPGDPRAGAARRDKATPQLRGRAPVG